MSSLLDMFHPPPPPTRLISKAVFSFRGEKTSTRTCIVAYLFLVHGGGVGVELFPQN
jgi:hypothetical protein